MNRPTHALVGAAVGSAGYYIACKLLLKEPSLEGCMLSAGAGLAVACLPDILEPAIHPNHRAFFHSIVFNGVVTILVWRRLNNPDVSVLEKIVLSVIGSAYVSHPLLDATTPMGLPII